MGARVLLRCPTCGAPRTAERFAAEYEPALVINRSFGRGRLTWEALPLPLNHARAVRAQLVRALT